MTPVRRLAAALAVAAIAVSQPVLAQDPKGKALAEQQMLKTVAGAPPVAQGVAARLLINAFGDVDGVLLESGTVVTFPAHMGSALANAVRKGDTITVQGYLERPGQVKGYVIGNAAVNRTVAIEPKPAAPADLPKHLRGVGLREMHAQGEIRHLRYGGKGEVNGAILHDGTIVRFPREVWSRHPELLRVGQGIAVSGYGTQNEHGRALEVTALGPAGSVPQPVYARR